jgi:hypothetical protein
MRPGSQAPSIHWVNEPGTHQEAARLLVSHAIGHRRAIMERHVGCRVIIIIMDLIADGDQSG